MSSEAYHLDELAIARSQKDPRRIMPPIPADCRRILDVGCGAGQILIASDLPSETTACGVDIDMGALQLGKKLDPRLLLVCGSGETLPLCDGCVDYVISRVSLACMHTPRAITEIARVLEPDGRLWLALNPFSWVAAKFARSVRTLNLRDCLFRLYVIANGLLLHFTGKQFRFPFGRRSCESYQTHGGMKRLLAGAGFGDIEIKHQDRAFIITARRAAAGQPQPGR